MRVLILNADYPKFLTWLYRRSPELANASYVQQMAARNASLFGVADFYSRNFIFLGHQATDIHVNNWSLQSAWAREHGMAVESEEAPATTQRVPAWLKRVAAPVKPLLRPLARHLGLSPRLKRQSEEILLAQVEEHKPDFVLNQDVFHVDSRLVRRIKQIGSPFLVGQVGIEPSRGVDWSPYDLMISQLPRIVSKFRLAGVRAEVNHLAFEPDILNRLSPPSTPDVDVSFVGSISEDHRGRIALLEFLARRYDLKIWGNISQTVSASSPLWKCLQGEVWGAEMYETLRRSRITLNSHIDIAGDEAGNVRLFEATGIGAFLLTDFKRNLQSLFEPDIEVAVWRSPEECAVAIDRYLADEGARKAVATAGQQKTLAHHTYRRRVEEILAFLAQ